MTKLIIPIFILAAFLQIYRLHETLFFIGDVGWFYLSARDMILTGQIPLVGIPSSHPWLHQGPLWTYMLAVSLWLFRFHPVSGALFPVLFGIGSVYLMYLVGKNIFTKEVGFLAALLYATSPLVIIHARMPYHTAPIPFFTLLLFYATYRWIRGNANFFPVALLSLSVLYNLELATVVFWFLFVFIIGYGVFKRQKWIQALKSPRVLLISLGVFLTPLLPILIYDTQNGFPQTIKFAAWIGYKILTLFGYPSLYPEVESTSLISVIFFFLDHIRKLLFLPSTAIAVILFSLSVFVFGRMIFRAYRRKKLTEGNLLLGLFFLVGLGGFFAAKTTSEAYLPMLFPFIILLPAYLFSEVIQIRSLKIVGFVIVSIIVVVNCTSLLMQNYLMTVARGGYGPTFSERLSIAEKVVKEAGKNEYTIKGVGKGSEFESYTMSHEYLTWWLGHGSSKSEQSLQFIIWETPEKIYLEKKEMKR